MSKNKKLFLAGGIIILIMTTIFYFSSKPRSLAVYIGFGFVWFSVILNVCLNYLLSYNAPEIKELMNVGYAVYFCLVFVSGVLFADTLGLFNVIFIDFFLVSAILAYIAFIRRLPGNKKKK